MRAEIPIHTNMEHCLVVSNTGFAMFAVTSLLRFRAVQTRPADVATVVYGRLSKGYLKKGRERGVKHSPGLSCHLNRPSSTLAVISSMFIGVLNTQ